MSEQKATMNDYHEEQSMQQRESKGITREKFNGRFKGCADSPDPSDEELIRLAPNRPREVFDELDRRYRQAAYFVAYNVLRNVADAWDAVQIGFTNAYTHLDSLQGQSAFKTWLFSVVRNAALTLRRQKSRRRIIEAKFAARLPSEETYTPPKMLLSKEQQELVIQFLQQHATPLMLQVYELRLRERLSYSKIARRIEGQTARSVRHAMDQLLSKLKKYMAQWE